MNKELKAYLYLSKANGTTDTDELDALIQHAKKANSLHQVTGFIVCQKGYFLQYLEGATSMVDQLMENISRDKRHEVVNSLTIPTNIRRFPDWSMQWNKENIGMETVLMGYMRSIMWHIEFSEELRNNIHRMIGRIATFYVSALNKRKV